MFEVDEIYLIGVVGDGNCLGPAISLLSDPDQALVGFTCVADLSTAVIHPTTKRLIYQNQTQDDWHEFECDNDCRSWSPEDEYPEGVQDNDPLVDLPCKDDFQVLDIRIGPDGHSIHKCGDANFIWYDREGTEVYQGVEVLWLAAGMLALVQDETREPGDGYLFVDLTTGSSVPITGMPKHEVVSMRAHGAGMYVALEQVDDAGERSGTQELWEIDKSGDARSIGDYPDLGGDPIYGWRGTLDKDGRLYQGNMISQILRRTTGGDLDVVYDQADEPLVRPQRTRARDRTLRLACALDHSQCRSCCWRMPAAWQHAGKNRRRLPRTAQDRIAATRARLAQSTAPSSCSTSCCLRCERLRSLPMFC